MFPLLVATALAAEPLTSGALADRILDAHGGVEALDKVQAYRMEGTIEALTHPEEGTFTRLYTRPLDLDVDLRYTTRSERRVLLGDRGWRTNADGIFTPSQGPLHYSMVLQAARAAIPWIVADRKDGAQLAPPLAIDGREHPGLRLPLGENLDITLWADPDTHLVRESRAAMTGQGKAFSFEVLYDDYRDVGGVRFAFSELTSAGGTPTSRMNVTKVELNPAEKVSAPVSQH